MWWLLHLFSFSALFTFLLLLSEYVLGSRLSILTKRLPCLWLFELGTSVCKENSVKLYICAKTKRMEKKITIWNWRQRLLLFYYFLSIVSCLHVFVSSPLSTIFSFSVLLCQYEEFVCTVPKIWSQDKGTIVVSEDDITKLEYCDIKVTEMAYMGGKNKIYNLSLKHRTVNHFSNELAEEIMDFFTILRKLRFSLMNKTVPLYHIAYLFPISYRTGTLFLHSLIREYAEDKGAYVELCKPCGKSAGTLLCSLMCSNFRMLLVAQSWSAR